MDRFEFKKNQIVNHIFELRVLDNPRRDDGGFGPICCSLCNSQPTALVEIIMKYDGCDWAPDIVLCKGCLDGMDKLINWGYTEQVKRGRNNV